MTSFFVTGTDTEIGKTAVAQAMVRSFVARGEVVAPMKPVASGCEGDPLRNADAEALISASGRDWNYDDVNPYCFAPPLAPHVAAHDAGVTIDLERIADCFERMRQASTRVVVEGVGGWCVPLGDDSGVEDLVIRLRIPVILVVGLRLGAINHAILSVREILRSECRLLGWVANHLDANDAYNRRMVATLDDWLPVPRIASLGHRSVDIDWSMRL